MLTRAKSTSSSGAALNWNQLDRPPLVAAAPPWQAKGALSHHSSTGASEAAGKNEITSRAGSAERRSGCSRPSRLDTRARRQNISSGPPCSPASRIPAGPAHVKSLAELGSRATEAQRHGPSAPVATRRQRARIYLTRSPGRWNVCRSLAGAEFLARAHTQVRAPCFAR